MASRGTFSIFSVLLFCVGGHSFVELQCNERNVGQIGQPSLLNCVVQPTQGTTDVTITNVAWRRSGDAKPFLYCNKKDGCTKESGYRFADSSPEWDNKNMNISLLITNTRVADEGKYTCRVFTDSGNDNAVVDLRVTAKYSLPNVSLVPEKETPNSEKALICRTSGGYPKGTIHWFGENDEDWTKSAKTVEKNMDNGLFELSSKLVLLTGSTFSKYTCVVFNSSGAKENEGAIQIPESQVNPNKASVQTPNVVAGVLVIGSLIVGLLLLLLIRRRRAQRPQHRGIPEIDFEASPLDSKA
uniref:Ig-like domain-containing protein n=1 Tax=Iconisemion striatum TaxID=60296 RepID=A0A1A7X3I0_9TELE